MTRPNLSSILHPFRFAKRLLALVVSLSFTGIGLVPPDANAANFNWLTNPTTGNWNTAGNWVENTAPNGGDILFFSNSTTKTLTNNTTTGLAYAFVLTDSGYVIGGNAIVLRSNADSELSNNITSGTNTINLTITNVTAGKRITSLTGGTLVLGGVLGGSTAGSLFFNTNTSGTVILTNANTTSNAFTVSGGILRIANSGGLGSTASGTTVVTNASLELTTNNAGNNISIGAEALNLSGVGLNTNGALRNLAGDNVYGGLIALGAASRVNSDSGTLSLTNTGTISGAFGLTFGGAGNVAVASIISNTTVTKDGAGTLFLTASNRFAGGTLINSGTIAISNNGVFGSNAVTFASNGTRVEALTGLQVTNNYNLAGNGTMDVETFILTNTGIISNTGSLTKEGAGTLILGRANTYRGGTVINAGTVAISNAASFGSNTVTFASNGTTVAALASILVTNNYALTGNGTMDVGANLVMTNSGAISGAGGLTKSGAGTVVLSASNNFSGTTTLSAGVLSLANTRALNASTLDHASAGSVSFSNLTAANLGGLQGSTGIVLTNLAGAAVALNVGGNDSSTTYSGALSGGGRLTKSGTGTLTLSGANTQSGGASIDAGALQIGAGGTTGSLAGLITNNASLIFNRSDNITQSTAISGTGSLTKNGAGTLILSASNSYSGGTLLNAGSLAAGNQFAFGSGAITLTNGTLLNLSNFTIANVLINNGGTLTNLGTVSGAELNGGSTTIASTNSTVAEVSGTAQVTVSGVNTTITNVTGGTVSIAGTNTTLQTVDAGTLNIAGANTTVQTLNGGNLNVTNGASVAVNAGNSAGSITGGGSLIKDGSGTLQLSGNNNFTGTTFISNGVVAISTNAALAGTTLINLNNGTALAYNGGTSTTIDRNIAVTNGTAAIVNSGGGTLTLAGTLSKNGTVLVFSNGTFNVTGVISGASANSDLVVDNATVTLSNANTYNGPTFIRNAGNLTAAVVGAMPTDVRSDVVMDDTGSGSSVFNVTANQQIASLTGAASSSASIATNTSLTVGAASGNTTFAGVISGGGSLVKDGASTQTLTGANTYSGTTTISGGVLAANNLANAGSASSIGTGSSVNLTNNGVLRYTGATVSIDRGINLAGNGGIGVSNSTTALTISGVISNTGGLSKFGAGTLVLSGANTFTGSTTVSSGTLDLNNASGSALGSTASVSVANGATLLISQNNQVNNSASITLSGGTISRGSGVSEVFGSLNLTQASFLDFGTGATGNLTFGTYQNNETPSALLTLNNFIPGNSFTFNSTSFTTNNVGSYFSFGTGYVNSSITSSGSTFTITAIPEPSTYLAAAGLLALMLWPSRRRIIRDAKKILGLRAPMRDRLAALRDS